MNRYRIIEVEEDLVEDRGAPVGVRVWLSARVLAGSSFVLDITEVESLIAELTDARDAYIRAEARAEERGGRLE